MTLQEIDVKIAETKEALANIKGTEPEVYTRIVGYYRSLRNWNKGKREEYNYRKAFDVNKSTAPAALKIAASTEDTVAADTASTKPEKGQIAKYSYFYRKTCPQCPPVKDFVTNLGMDGDIVDVDTEEGFNKALEFNVMATPTVIFFDEKGNTLFHGHELNKIQDAIA